MIAVIMDWSVIRRSRVSLRSGGIGSVPEQTARVARAAFPQGALAMRIRDRLGPVFTDTDFVDLFPRRGKPGLSPALLTMCCCCSSSRACRIGMR